MTTAPSAALSRLTLVDGSGFIFRAFHGLPMMTRSDGTPVNAVYGFTTMLLKLVQAADTGHLAVIFDAGRRTFRNDIYPEYKAQRPPPPPELVPQFALIRQLVEAFSLPAIELPGFEADDLIASYAAAATAAGAQVTIVSSDKDLMQLVTPQVCLFDPMKERMVGPAEVFEKFGVSPDKVVDVQALAGDPTDNVPGVAGIGIKTAAQLITDYGDLDSLLARAGEIKQPKRRQNLLEQADLARISRDLVRLRQDTPLPQTLDDLAPRLPDPATLLGFLRAQGFRALVGRVDSWLGTLPLDAVAPAQGNAGQTIPAAPVVRATAAETFPTSADPMTPAVPEDGPVSRDRYQLVLSPEALEHWIERGIDVGIIAVDTETTGLDPLRADLVGVSLAVAPGEACYIPLRHSVAPAPVADLFSDPVVQPAGPRLPDPALMLAGLKRLLEHPGVLKVGHNIKYDLHVLARAGLAVAPVDDTMLISYVLDSSGHGHGMDELSGLHLGHETIPFSAVCGTGKAQITFDRVPLDQACAYAAEDADVTLRLYRRLRPRLLAEHRVGLHETLERPLIPVLRAMEAAGILVDKVDLQAMSREFAERMGVLEQEIHGLAGRPFNLASPKQLGEILFDELKLPGGKKGKTGAYATGAEVLEGLAEQHPLPEKLLDWRQIAKLKSTYADALVEQINPATGRVHTRFAMTVTSTGRLSSSDPNLQNIPVRTAEGKRMRRAFIAAPGMQLMSADYSQIELRLVAHVADIAGLKQAFADGADIHAITASQVFGVPLAQMDGETRRRAKAINFGILYGISAFGLGKQLGIPNGEAKRLIDAYFDRYPEIRRYMDKAKADARDFGAVMTPFGRRCVIPDMANKAMRSFAERAAINAPIQGGAADIIKRAMVRLPDALQQAGLSARLLLQVHDELVLEVPDAEIADTRTLVRDVMENSTKISVPLTVEVGVGPNWGAAH